MSAASRSPPNQSWWLHVAFQKTPWLVGLSVKSDSFVMMEAICSSLLVCVAIMASGFPSHLSKHLILHIKTAQPPRSFNLLCVNNATANQVRLYWKLVFVIPV